MNAYKLAEELQGFGYLENDLHFCPFQAQVDMLRHQADYIAQLEKGLESSIAMNKAQAKRQVKELTDEEIISCVNKEFDLELKADNATVLAFSRAILRKAQEK